MNVRDILGDLYMLPLNESAIENLPKVLSLIAGISIESAAELARAYLDSNDYLACVAASPNLPSYDLAGKRSGAITQRQASEASLKLVERGASEHRNLVAEALEKSQEERRNLAESRTHRKYTRSKL